MAIVKNGLVVKNVWQALDGRDPSEMNTTTPLIVSRAELETHRGILAEFPTLGLELAPSDDARDIADDLASLGLVTVTLPKFNDGRAFSQARLLREALDFKGEIRATGHILRDQLNFLRRSGVDAIEVTDSADAWAKTWDSEAIRFGGYYQPALDGKSNRSPAGPLRRWANPALVGGVAVGVVAVHDAGCAGAWAY